MHINAFLREIKRVRLLITGGFHGRPIQRSHFWLQGSKGRCHGNQILAKIGQKITKMAITSVVCNICVQSLVFETGIVLSGNSSVTLPYTRDKEALPWQPIVGQKFKCISTRDNENAITYNMGLSCSTNPKKTFLIARSKERCPGITKLWPK